MLLAEVLADTVSWTFSTGSDRIQLPPDVASEPATTIPDWGVSGGIAFIDDELSEPPNGEISVDPEIREVLIRVHDLLDLTTITVDTVTAEVRDILPPYSPTQIPVSIVAVHEGTDTLITLRF